MRKAGVHDAVTNAITGHSDGTMRSRYDVVDFKDLMEGIQKLEDFLGSVDQTVDQSPISTKKDVNQLAVNLLNYLVPKGGLEPPQGLLLTRP